MLGVKAKFLKKRFITVKTVAVDDGHAVTSKLTTAKVAESETSY